MKRAGLALIAALSILALQGSAAVAQPKDKAKVKSYDFTGDDIDGDLVKPDGVQVDTRVFASHTSLIRIRKDFIKEILKSAEDL